MPNKAKPIPEGYHTVTPYLIVDGGVAALDFYKKAFGAKEMFRFPMPNGKLGHAEIKIGDSHIMLADEPDGPMADTPDHQVYKSPKASGRTGVGISPLCGRCGRLSQTGRRRGRQGIESRHESVLRRSFRNLHGSVRSCLDTFDTHRRRVARRDDEARTAARPLDG